MASVRWRKLRRDIQAAWGRVLVMQLAIALALAGVGTVLGARAVLDRGIRASYLGARPAEATLELPGGVDEALLAAVRARGDVAEADRRQMVQARIRSRPDAPWQALVLFAADAGPLRLQVFRPQSGSWPPPPGAILVERSAVGVISAIGGGGGNGASRGQSAVAAATTAAAAAAAAPRAIVQTPHGSPLEIELAGTVHDGGLAPSWQEHRAYGYTTIETLALLGEPPLLRDLLVQFRPAPRTTAEVEVAASALARWLVERGHPVHEIRIPKLRQHPHQGLMTAVQLVLLLFSLLLVVLTAVVLATMLSAILARQARELGVMKAIGASTGQLVALYAGFVIVIGAGSLLVAIPLAYAGARAMASQVAAMMNLAAFDARIPRSVFVALAVLGTLVPLVFAMVPILRAARVTVRQSLSQHGASADFARPSVSRLPIPLRNALRRPVRLAFSMTLLGMAGTLVLSAANTQHGLTRVSSKLSSARHFDIELRLHEPVPAARITAVLGALPGAVPGAVLTAVPGAVPGAVLTAIPGAIPGVLRLESWPAVDAAVARPGKPFDVMHTYPDGGHGSSLLTAPPSGSTALNLPVRRGRWLGVSSAVAGVADVAGGAGGAGGAGVTNATDVTNGTNVAGGTNVANGAGVANVAGEVVLGHGHPAARGTPLGGLVTLSVEGKRSTWRLVGVVEEIGGASAFVNEDDYRRATGDTGVRLLRLTTTARSSTERDAIIAELERTLAAAGISVQYAMPALLLRSIIDDHVAMVVRAVIAMAGLLALVGFFGLGSMTAIGVAERTREIGVMKALGASQRRILGLLLAESLAIAAVSSVLAALLSLPMTALINAHVAIGFLAPPSFTVSPLAYLAWPAATLAGSALACWLPARRAARLSIRQALAEV